jgi:tripartite-type tricarboxylate transporter receptor subunit TctC
MRSITRTTRTKIIATVLMAPAAVAPAIAQQFPGSRTIEMTVMFGAGSAADITARLLLIARVSLVLAILASAAGMAACWYFFQKLLALQLPMGPF